MNYAKIKTNCTSNGDGIRVALFVSGCSFRCSFCQNKELWNPDYGKKFSNEIKEKMFDEVSKSHYNGISLLGGEPLYKNNIEEITKLAREFKERFPNKTSWLYTGNIYEAISDYEILQYADIVVDGLFEMDKFSPRLKFRGSSNQRIIDVKETLLQKEIILATQYYER